MLFYLYGPDSFRSAKKLKEIEGKFVREVDPSRLNSITLDGTSLTADEFSQHLCASPFLARKRMVIVKQLLSGSRKKEVADLIKDLLEQKRIADSDDVIAVFWEPTDPSSGKKPSGLHAYLAKQKFATEYKTLTPGELESWIALQAQELTATIDPQAVRALAAAIGPDLWRISHELAKLSHYAGGAPITQTLVTEQVRSEFDDSIFNLIDAIGTRQKAKALALLTAHLAGGEHELGILSMLQKHYRTLLLVRERMEADPRVTKDSLASELAIHPFVAQKAMAQSRAYTVAQLEALYHRLVSIDFDIKDGQHGELLLDLLIASL